MNNLRLKREEVEKLAHQIFGPKSFLFLGDLFEIFYERSPLSLLSSFSQRFEKLCETKSKLGNSKQIGPALSEFYSQVLNYLKSSNILKEEEYLKELQKCQKIWDRFFLK